MKFKTGDRVRINQKWTHIGTVSQTDVGTVQLHDGCGSYYIRWDDYDIRKHDNGGRCEGGHGWIVNEKYLIPATIDDLGELPEANTNAKNILFDL